MHWCVPECNQINYLARSLLFKYKIVSFSLSIYLIFFIFFVYTRNDDIWTRGRTPFALLVQFKWKIRRNINYTLFTWKLD